MTPTETIALRNLPGFRWVDWFMRWPTFLRLPTILLTLFILFGVGSLLNRAATDILALTLIHANTLVVLAVWVIMARGAQSDFESIGYAEINSRLAPSSRIAWIESGLGLALGVVLMPLLTNTTLGIATSHLVNVSNPASLGWWLIVWVFVLLAGVVSGHLAGFLLRQCFTFAAIAKQIPLRLAQLDDVQAFANPLLRHALLQVLASAFMLIGLQFIEVENRHYLVGSLIFPILIVSAAFLCLPLYPILLLRARIREIKRRELDLVRQALRGNRAVLANSELGATHTEFATPDLMYYEERVGRIWEWPIQQHVQRLLFYILIPPAAWVMAALVERMLDTWLH